MSHLVAYIGSEPEYLACALFQTRLALYWNDPGEPDGWGLGFVQGGEVLLQKRPRPQSHEVDFYALARDLRADALVGRAGLTADGKTASENADPFRFRSWLFCTVGDIHGFENVRERMLGSVPDFLRRNIRGRSPSEHLFHLFLSFLHDAGRLEMQTPEPEVVRRALRESLVFLDRLLIGSGAPPSRLVAVVTNGRSLVAEVRDYPAHYLEINGIGDCASPTCPDRQRMSSDRHRIIHEGLRAVVLEADEDQPRRGGWQQLPPGSSLLVGLDRRPVVATS